MNKTYSVVAFFIIAVLLGAVIFFTMKKYIAPRGTANTNSVMPLVTKNISPTSQIDDSEKQSVTDTKSGAVISTDITPVPTVNEIQLRLTSPADGSTSTSQTVTVSGVTSPFAEVFVNEFDTTADTSGNFSVNVSLEDGDNMIVVVANAPDGKFSEKELTVYYSSE